MLNWQWCIMQCNFIFHHLFTAPRWGTQTSRKWFKTVTIWQTSDDKEGEVNFDFLHWRGGSENLLKGGGSMVQRKVFLKEETDTSPI